MTINKLIAELSKIADRQQIQGQAQVLFENGYSIERVEYHPSPSGGSRELGFVIIVQQGADGVKK